MQLQKTYAGNTNRTGAGQIGAATGDAIANSINIMNAEAGIGLTIMVSDINYPSWFIRFKKSKTVEQELIQWMEILQQFLNENKVNADTVKDTGSMPNSESTFTNSNFCSKCGARINQAAVFCSVCGDKLQ